MASSTALPTSGAISFNQLQTELGGTNPISISEYYKVTANNAFTPTSAFTYNVPTSGAISLSNFRGVRKTLWAGTIYPAQYAVGTNDEAFGFDVANGVGSATRTAGIYTLSSFFFYNFNSQTYVTLASPIITGTTLIIQKGIPGTSNFGVGNGYSISGVASNWLTVGGVFVSIGAIGEYA